MNQKTIGICIALFILIVVGMFTFAYLKKQEMKTDVPVVQENSKTENVYPEVVGVTAKHYFIDGVHTFAGEITLPTPCDLLQSETIVRESMPEQVVLNFSVINTAQGCIQQITSQRFKTSVTASESATFSAQFMARTIPLNLIPAAVGEKPEDFELFIKG